MASITVRDIPDPVKERFRARAKAHGRSMEAHLRKIIEEEANLAAGREETLEAIAAFARENAGWGGGKRWNRDDAYDHRSGVFDHEDETR